MPTIRYRDEVLPTDADAVRRMTAETDFFRPDEVDVATELVEERLARDEASEYFFWFAYPENAPAAPIGYVCYGPTPCALGAFDLYWIVVDRSHRREGLGRELLRLAERSARAAAGRKLYIETSGKDQYLPTRKFYLGAGYRVAARLADFYDVGDDKLILEKDLEPGETPDEAGSGAT